VPTLFAEESACGLANCDRPARQFAWPPNFSKRNAQARFRGAQTSGAAIRATRHRAWKYQPSILRRP